MVTLTIAADTPGPPRLGQPCRFEARGDSLESVRFFLEHEGVFYPQALPVDHDHSVRLYPEAPGRYVLHASWSSARGEHGWARTEFTVRGAQGSAPQRVRVDGHSLWVPTPWDAQLMTAHERAATRELQRILRPGATVYDIGANIGLFSTQFAHWVGRDGWLYAIEPNPTCIYFLRANLSQLRHRNFAILPVAISSAPGMLDFVLNYGSSLIGVGTDTSPAAKPGHHIAIEKQPLDTLIATMQLRQPDFIKLDVEGAEGDAVAGMMNTLENSRPGLMIELHGRAAAAATFHQLAGLGYEYLSCSSGVRYPSAEAVLASLPDACVQVIGYP